MIKNKAELNLCKEALKDLKGALATLKKYWYNKEGVYHREDGPAVSSEGYKAWYINGLRHREDGPAIEWKDGTKEWYINGLLHREDGIEWKDGYKAWYIGLLHREDGPAHREDGPAVERKDGIKVWYLNGKEISKEFHHTLTQGPIKDLPMYLRMGYDYYISMRLSQ